MTIDNGATRALAAIVVAAAFLLVLVVASVQEQATAQLKAHNIDMSYSVARSKLDQASDARNDLKSANLKISKLRDAGAGLENTKGRIELDLYARLQDVAAAARAIARSSLCPMLTQPPPASGSVDASLWSTVQDCARDDKAPPAVSGMLTDLGSPSHNPTMIKSAMDRLDQRIKNNDREGQQAETDAAKAQQSIDDAKAVTDALQDVVVLDDNGLVSRVTRFPPILMQILLSFIAGLFGALLLTLIIAVYPHNDFSFVESKSYWKRIFLGGLIAVAIFVVIGSGVAVLGSSRALIDDANVMSYTAVGLLAGMFSERVAGFLSNRGNIFTAPAPAPPQSQPAPPFSPPAPSPPGDAGDDENDETGQDEEQGEGPDEEPEDEETPGRQNQEKAA